MKNESDAILVIKIIKIENKLVFFLKKTQKDSLIDMACETDSLIHYIRDEFAQFNLVKVFQS